MQNVEIKDQNPHCSKHVLPAVPSSEVYLEDCVTALKRFNDNHFDLAIVDPPYGIGASADSRVGGIAGNGWRYGVGLPCRLSQPTYDFDGKLHYTAGYAPFLFRIIINSQLNEK